MADKREEWLAQALAQLRCQKAVPGVKQELQDHLESQYQALLAQGLPPEQAQEETVRSMGDPVQVGTALDAVHRPQPAVGPLAVVLCLLCACGLLPVLAGGITGSAVLGVLVPAVLLVAVYLWGDLSLIARHSGRLYAALLLGTLWALGPMGARINGRIQFTAYMGGLQAVYGALCFAMLFIPVYAGVLLAWRHKGWRGLALSALALAPGLAICLWTPHFTAGLTLGLTGVVLLAVCAGTNWFGVGRAKGLAAVLGGTAALLAAAAAPSLPAILRHLRQYKDVADAGYFANGLHRLWQCMAWVGPGDGTQMLSAQLPGKTVADFFGPAERTLQSDYLLAWAGWQWGKAAALALMLLAAAALVLLWRAALHTRHGMGRLCGIGVCTMLTAQTLLALAVSTGLANTSALLPFGGDVTTTCAQAVLAGLLLNAFRLDTVIPEQASRISSEKA